MDLSNKTAAEISNEIVSVEKNIKIEIDNRAIINNQIYVLSRRILELDIKKRELMIGKSKSSDNIRKLELDKSILRSAFWSTKESGL